MKSEIVLYIPQEEHSAQAVSFKKLLGLRLFTRGILTLAEAGYTNFTLLAPSNQRRAIYKSLGKRVFNNKPSLRIHTIFTRHGRNMDVDSMNELLKINSSKIIFLNTNLLFTKNTLKHWLNLNICDTDVWLGDGDFQHPHLIGMQGTLFQDVLENQKKSDQTIEAILRTILTLAQKQVRMPPDEPVFYVASDKDIRRGERYLTERIRFSTTGIVARYINKRISLPISRVLAKLRISPNTITVFNMLIGLSAGIGAAGRTYTGLLLGAILFQLASIIDGCDGEVAKLTFRSSKFGQYIDTISDNFALTSFFLGLTIHHWRVTDNLYAFVWGAALLLGIAILLVIMMTYLKHNTNSFSLVTYDKEYLEKLPPNYPVFLLKFIQYGKYLLKKDCFSFMFLLSAIIGILPAWLYITTIGVWVGVFVLVYLNLKPVLVKNGFSDKIGLLA